MVSRLVFSRLNFEHALLDILPVCEQELKEPANLCFVILFSVLDLLDFPSSSSSTITIKVSMGKREFRIWDKGYF
ncbi:hypothetical protein MKW98_013114 [Papaver atlanticum]|uniref:Uncharacterized protein n=1 Tax=Papaver atlanticum TaxID=357466 RepID=A0AAD4T8I0_9MAGN|nr:hypothetical protein MKW98_013114 [Papaver atlanticum]